MRKLLVVILILLFLSALSVQAQDEVPQAEILTVLLDADGIFEPDLWLSSAAENLASTTATWQSRMESGFSGLSYMNYLHFDTGYSLDNLDALFDDDWFQQTFAGWEDLRKTNVCFDEDLTLHEFTLAFRDSNNSLTAYALRYWIEPVSETRVRAWYISFATVFADGTPNEEGLDLLDDYAERMYPDLPDCAV
jgi:hypothetical protein